MPPTMAHSLSAEHTRASRPACAVMRPAATHCLVRVPPGRLASPPAARAVTAQAHSASTPLTSPVLVPVVNHAAAHKPSAREMPVTELAVRERLTAHSAARR
jgi:hypothetical protein